jgi:hypothetical protein
MEPDIFTEDGRPKKSFKERLDKYFKDLKLKEWQAENVELKPKQIYPAVYMTFPSVRGLYINMGLGQGKSLLAIHTAHLLKRHTIVLLPSSIKPIFLEDIGKYYNLEETNPKEIEMKVSAKFTFISSNSPYVAKELEVANQDMDTSLKSLLEVGKLKFNALDDKFLIIDEAHRFTSTIVGGSDNGGKVMKKINTAQNLKIMLMSATPIINDPFELVPAFSMLYKGKELFSKSYQLFNEYFIKSITKENISLQSLISTSKKKGGGGSSKTKKETKIEKKEERKETKKIGKKETKIEKKEKEEKTEKIKLSEMINKHIFQERIMGMVAYYPGIEDLKSEDFPEKLDNEFLFLEMDYFQWESFLAARFLEQEEEIKASAFKSKKETVSGFGRPKSEFPTSYKVKTRMISNFAIPLYIKVVSGRAKKMLKQSERNVLYHNYIAQIKDDDLKVSGNLRRYSCKFFHFINHLPKSTGKIFAYSNFISIGGLGILEKVLSVNDYTQITSIASVKNIKPNYKNFVSLTGDMDKDTMFKFLSLINSKENDDGRLVKVLLVSSIAGGGLNLLCFREVHFFEFYWNYTTMTQLEGRVSRYMSHSRLPSKDRNYKTYYYFAVQPKGVDIMDVLGEGDKEGTTDVKLLNLSMRKKYLSDQFLDAIKGVSINCGIHGFDFCLSCSNARFPDKELCPADLNVHLLPSGSKCIKPSDQAGIERSKKKLKRIHVDGVDYYIDEKDTVYDKLSTGEIVSIGYLSGEGKQKKIKKIA